MGYPGIVTLRPTKLRAALERSISFYPLSVDQIVDDLMKIRPMSRPTKTKPTKRRKKKTTTNEGVEGTR